MSQSGGRRTIGEQEMEFRDKDCSGRKIAWVRYGGSMRRTAKCFAP